MGRFLVCMTCGTGHTFEDDAEDDVVPQCATCQGREWRNPHDPKVRYSLTHNDKRLLRSLRIEAEPETTS